MRRAGFVLAGGNSTRMGQDKALLPWGTSTLVEAVALRVHAAAGFTVLIGDPGRYSGLGYPVQGDLHPGCGPLSGLETLLSLGLGEWNLMVACDLPYIREELLRSILHLADSLREVHEACVIPVIGTDGWQPLCAAYHASCLPAVTRAITNKRFKMMNLLKELRTVPAPQADPSAFCNVNTPGDWAGLAADFPS